MAEYVKAEGNTDPVGYTENIEQNGMKLKEEFGKSIQEIIDKLVEKREAVFKEIDDIVKEGSEDMKKKENEVEQMHRVRRSISEMEGSAISNKLIESINEEISVFELQIPSIKIKWNYSVSKLLGSISNLADVEKYYKSPYKLKGNPIWTAVTQGKGDTELVKPGGIAVDEETNDIYIGDRASAKILVFAQNGVFKRFFSAQTKHNMISKLCIYKNNVFFISEALQTPLYKVRKDNGQRIAKQAHSRKLNKLTMDHNGNVFTCNESELNIFYCNSDLGNNNQMKITSSSLKGNLLHATRILDIKVFAKLIYCLFNNSEIPIHVFSRRGEFIRPIRFNPTPLQMNVNLINMYIDKKGNILVNFGLKEGGIKVYNPEGEFVEEVGKQGKGKEEMIEPREIVVIGESQTVVVSNANPLNMLVAY